MAASARKSYGSLRICSEYLLFMHGYILTRVRYLRKPL